jgi:hypothetical protein
LHLRSESQDEDHKALRLDQERYAFEMNDTGQNPFFSLRLDASWTITAEGASGISGRPNRSRGFEVLQLRYTRANAQAETSSAISSAGLAGEIGLNLLTICGD